MKATVTELREKAEQGNASAQLRLGIAYANGRGVPQDDAESARWHELAARQGNALSQWNLGLAYARGKGVGQDFAKAVIWIRQAAQQGDAVAQRYMGKAYAEGKGVEQDIAQAYVWFSLAISQGLEFAVKNRTELRKTMTPEQINEAERLLLKQVQDTAEAK